ncbi:unnamed protein product [Diamesa tonsa]
MKCLEASETMNWMKFILIAEALEQSQSHLIQPTLSNLHQIKFSEDHDSFIFILCKMIITHENTVIKNWGLIYVLNEMSFTNDDNIDDDKIIIILNQLNSTCLYEDDNECKTVEFEDLLISFIHRNFDIVFRNINKIIWTSVPFFHIITAIHKSIEKLAPSMFNQNFIKMLENQTLYVGKKIQNLTIRAGVQSIYSQILLILVQHVDPKDLNTLIQIIFNMGECSKALTNIELCLTSMNNDCLIFPTDQQSWNYNKYLYTTLLLSEQYSYEKFITSCTTLPNSEKLIIQVLDVVINDNVDFIPHYQERYLNHFNELEMELNKEDLSVEKVINLIDILKCKRIRFDVQTVDQFQLIYTKVLLHKTHPDYKAMEMNILTIMSKFLRKHNLMQFSEAIYCFLNVNLEERSTSTNYHFVNLMFNLTSFESEYWLTECVLKYFNIIMNKCTGTKKTYMLTKFYKTLFMLERTETLDPIIIVIMKQGVVYGEILTKDQNIEAMISRRIHKQIPSMSGKSTVDGSKFIRLNSICYLRKYCKNYEDIVEELIVELGELSKKKPKGYFLNSLVHHQKLRYLQPVLFCQFISSKCEAILLNEIMNINNQTNISAIVEIILAHFDVDVWKLIEDEQLELKSTTLKSIFAILTMQLRCENDSKAVEVRLQKLITHVMPYTMGQNFGTRIFAQAAIMQCWEHLQLVLAKTPSEKVIQTGNEACAMIQKSLKAKNAAKYFKIAQNDFRFTLNVLDELWTFDAFYVHILRITNMSEDGIIYPVLYHDHDDKWFDTFLCKDNSLELLKPMENCMEPEHLVVNEELEIVDHKAESSMNLQQKYVPYKFQIPGGKLLSTLPTIFDDGTLKPRSELTVVASLVSRPPNLGGLARTCEVFGTENFIIDSLKIIENTEFKALSKTAEKWLKISEIKSWQLFDFLLNMKMQGYAIVGAEQTAKSKNLIGTPIPKKAVLLLGEQYSYEKFITCCTTLPNSEKLIIQVLDVVINDNVDFIPHYQERYLNHLNVLETELNKEDLSAEKVINLMDILNCKRIRFDVQTVDQFQRIYAKILLHQSHSDYKSMEMNILTIMSKFLRKHNLMQFSEAIYCFLNVNLEERSTSTDYQYLKCYIEICFNYLESKDVSKRLNETNHLNNTLYLIECCHHDDLLNVIKLLDNFLNFSTVTKMSKKLLSDVVNRIFTEILNIKDNSTFYKCFKSFVNLMFNLTSFESEYWLTECVLKYFNIIMNKCTGTKKTYMLTKFYKTLFMLERTETLDPIIIEIMKQGVVYGEILTKDQNIEAMISRRIHKQIPSMSGKSTVDGSKFIRLNSICYLRKHCKNYEDIVEELIVELGELSKKKPKGYFLNSLVHHQKLRYLQPVLFCQFISSKCEAILLNEIMNINNQTNISAIIEIILAHFDVDVWKLIEDEQLDLKSTTLKSIFAILTMQLRCENDSKAVELRLQKLITYVMPYTMGQNFGTRIFAQAAIMQCWEHLQSVLAKKVPSEKVIQTGNEACAMIQKSLKAKNAAKYFKIAQNDFRFTLNVLDELWTFDAFYVHILRITNMSEDGIIYPVLYHDHDDKWFDTFLCKDKSLELLKPMENCMEPEHLVVNEELEVVEHKAESSMNLQQKYVPYKFQIPGGKLLSSLPTIFDDGTLKPRSELTVVASLVSRPPNLGGLARTCEVFGTENFIIDSLKIIENTEFKALSKTAEKWLKITEIKSWQLFDFLLNMKMQGYAIVGAEQTAKSKNLIGTPIPKKAVLLLGHEKEGIPANLLALLDLTIEIPQNGVVRSLNVHVSGSIIMWEYAKQHLFSHQDNLS